MWHRCNLAANESRLECACVNNDDFAVLVSGSSRHCWVSLCTYVAVTFKMTGRVEQQVCLQFCIKLEHSSTKTISVIQKPTAGDWQLHHDNVPTHASCLRQNFLVKHQITQWFGWFGTQWFGTQWFLAFSKTKITFEREKISDRWWNSGKCNRAADGKWENCVRLQGAYFEGDWGIIVLRTMFLVSSSINISLFTWLDTFWTDLVCGAEKDLE